VFPRLHLREGRGPLGLMNHKAVPIEPLPSQAASRPSRSAIHLRLREETAALHAALDDGLDLLAFGLTIERYLSVLKAFYGFHAPLEVLLARVASVAPPPFPLARRAELLERDLAAVGVPPHEVAALPRCAEQPRLPLPEHLAGCSYVLEGAALGGRIIARELERRLGITRDSGASFFVGEGAGTAARWTRVLAWLDEVARKSGREDEIVAAAIDTFRALTSWLHARGALR
jgi:heme oxygenase